MRYSSYDPQTGLIFDEHTQAFVTLADIGAEALEDETDDFEDADTGAAETDKMSGESYELRTLRSDNAQLKTQLAAALRKIEQMQAQREQEMKDRERLSELEAVGMGQARQLAEIRKRVRDQDEGDLMNAADDLARSRHGRSYAALCAENYNAAVRVLADAQRETAY